MARDFFAVRDTIKATLKKQRMGLLFNGSNENYLGILFCVPEGRELTLDGIQKTIRALRASLYENCGIRARIGVGRIHEQLLEMPLSYKEAGQALSYQGQLMDADALFYEELPLPGLFADTGHKQLIQFSELLEMGQFAEAQAQAERIFSDPETGRRDPKALHESYLDLLSVIRVNAMVNGLECGFLQQCMREHGTQASVDQMKSGLRSALFDYQRQLEAVRAQSALSIVERAKRLIQTNDPSALSLEFVASSIYVNPSYLSQLFHRETGKKFIDYLTELRMEKAKELMKDPRLKIYEIGEAVGYPNKRYFSKLFEKYTRMTPSAYRRYLSGR